MARVARVTVAFVVATSCARDRGVADAGADARLVFEKDGKEIASPRSQQVSPGPFYVVCRGDDRKHDRDGGTK